MFRISMTTVFVACAALTGCGATLPQLRRRASVDFACNAASLQVEKIDSATEIVTGCGRRAVYVQLFNNARYPTWLLNSNVETPRLPPGTQSAR
jgi:hypothetical protein